MAGKVQNLFGSSHFMLPEQREVLLQMKEDQKLISRPQLEEDERNEIHYRIQDSQQYEYAIKIKWWHPVKGERGFIREVWGVVQRVDGVGRRIQLTSDEDVQWIDLEGIITVQLL